MQRREANSFTGEGGMSWGRIMTALLRIAGRFHVGPHQKYLEERVSTLGRLQDDGCEN